MTKIRRFYDAKTLNKLVNRADILPYVAPGYESLDASAFFKRPGNVAFKAGRGAMLFAERRKGVYDTHYLFPTDMRGPEALKIARAIVAEVFTSLRAKAMVGKVPVEHMRSRVFTRALGFVPTGRCRDSSGRKCIGYILERGDPPAPHGGDLSAVS